MKRRTRTALTLLGAGAFAYLGGSYLAARRLANRLISPSGLTPATARREELLADLRREASIVVDHRHPGSARAPAVLAALFASPGEPERRATILFLHGKGGSSAEWRPDALRSLRLGYNVLLPDLRGHRPSEDSWRRNTRRRPGPSGRRARRHLRPPRSHAKWRR